MLLVGLSWEAKAWIFDDLDIANVEDIETSGHFVFPNLSN